MKRTTACRMHAAHWPWPEPPIRTAQHRAGGRSRIGEAEEWRLEVVDDVGKFRPGLEALGEPVAVPGIDVERCHTDRAAPE